MRKKTSSLGKVKSVVKRLIMKPCFIINTLFLKVPRSGGEPGILLIFIYFLSQAAP